MSVIQQIQEKYAKLMAVIIAFLLLFLGALALLIRSPSFGSAPRLHVSMRADHRANAVGL